jgi:hypothetical protein
VPADGGAVYVAARRTVLVPGQAAPAPRERILCAASAPGTARFDVRFGSVIVFDSQPINLNLAGKTAVGWLHELLLTHRTVGGGNSAIFVFSLQRGTTVTLAWSTDIFRSYSGNEQRSSLFPLPRQRLEGNAFLLDARSRDVRGVLQRAAATGATFLLALPYEEILLTADAVGRVLSVASTPQLDWSLPGQRCVVMGRDGADARGRVVQSSTTIGAVANRSAWAIRTRARSTSAMNSSPRPDRWRSYQTAASSSSVSAIA